MRFRRRELHFSESNLQWVVTAYALTFGGFLLLGGRAPDLLGRRRIMMAGLGLFTAASLGAGLATSSGFLIATRWLQGLGAAVVLPAALSIVTNMFTEGADRNKALGAWGAIGGTAATVGLITGGLVTRYVGWQYIFFLNVPVGVAALLLAPRIVPESRLVGLRRRFDPLGAVTATGGLLALVYAISNAPQVGWSSARTVALLVVSAIGALTGVAEREAGLASGLLNTSQQLGGAIGVAIASTVAATRLRSLLAQGDASRAALTGGFQWAFWVCGAIALLAPFTTAVVLRRAKVTRDVVPVLD